MIQTVGHSDGSDKRFGHSDIRTLGWLGFSDSSDYSDIKTLSFDSYRDRTTLTNNFKA